MTSFHGKTLPRITDDQMFEKFVAALWERRHKGCSVTMMGRPGQTQSGLDVIVRTSAGDLIGIQCKATAKLTEAMLVREAGMASGHKPNISRFVLVSTAPHDAKLVTAAQKLTDENLAKGMFPVDVYGWSELLRLCEPYPEIVRRFFPEFTMSDATASKINLSVDDDGLISLTDTELALFCSETASALRNDARIEVKIRNPEEERILGELDRIKAEERPTTDQRAQRSYLEALHLRLGPRLRRLEQGIPVLLMDDNFRAPWLIGPDWAGTATALRQFCLYVLKPAFSRPDDALTIKMRSATTPAILAYLDFRGDDRAEFLARNPSFYPEFFLGAVADLGHELGVRYALPAGLDALLRYSTGFEVELAELRKQGQYSVYLWNLEAS